MKIALLRTFVTTTTFSLALLFAMGAMPVWAQGHDGHDHNQQGEAKGLHGGHVVAVGEFHIEVFYAQQETRVYLYDARRQPVSARGMRGELVMQVRDNAELFRYPLMYVQAQGEDFLGAPIDVSRVRDGDMQVTVDLQGLPSQTTPATRFAQVFALSQRPLTVTVAQLTQADQAGIARQKICPVMNTPLGDHGAPIKLVVGDQPIYVCCKGCVSQVQDNPEAFLGSVQAIAAAQSAANKSVAVTISDATQADQAAIRAQGRCVVMTDQALGGHGAPIKIAIGAEALFVCCKGCVAKVQQNPGMYLSRAQEMRRGR